MITPRPLLAAKSLKHEGHEAHEDNLAKELLKYFLRALRALRGESPCSSFVGNLSA
jgi:hypothetical protein